MVIVTGVMLQMVLDNFGVYVVRIAGYFYGSTGGLLESLGRAALSRNVPRNSQSMSQQCPTPRDPDPPVSTT